MKYLPIVIVLAVFGCSNGSREYLYPEARMMFKQGVSPEGIEAMFGKPQIVDKYSGDPSWTYVPKRWINRGQPGEVRGFIVEFKNGKSYAIEEYVVTVGKSY